MVEEYVSYLPTVYPSYESIHVDARRNYRVGVGEILMKWGPERSLYSALEEKIIPAGLADGLRAQPYVLLPQAFLTDSDNYRVDTLNRIFKKLGFDDAFAFVRSCASIQAFASEVLGGEQTPDGYLNAFVGRRNEVAHGGGTDVVDAEQIEQYAEFAYLILEALAALLVARLLKDGIAQGFSSRIASVVHCYSDCVVGVRANSGAKICVGDKLYVGRGGFFPAHIQSIRTGADSHKELDLADGVEFGLKLSRRAPRGADIYVRLSP